MNEQIFFAFILGTLLLTILTVSLGLFLFAHKRKQQQNRAEKQQLETEHKTEMLRMRLEEQEKSMTLISEEIHDNIGQVLGLARMYLHNATALIRDDEARNFGVMAGDLITNAITDLRHISHSLNSELLQRMGLVNVLEREISFLQETTEMRCSFNVCGEPYELSRQRGVLVYRIIQETLQNAVKHSGASSVTLHLEFGPQAFRVTVKDDGRGFDVAAACQSNSLGLRNIQNRANLVRAALDIQSSPESGTTLSLVLPNI